MNLNQVTVGTSDVSRSISFYTNLGLKLIVHSEDHYARFQCPDGTSTFSVHQVEDVNENQTAVYFECDDLNERVQELLGNGVVFSKLPTDQTWLWREAHLSDPDGNKMILYYAGENRLNPPWRIN